MRNSWGTGWGENGYIKIDTSRQKTNKEIIQVIPELAKIYVDKYILFDEKLNSQNIPKFVFIYYVFLGKKWF